jgi:16S rRNA (cytidine1402-2'-O)-methyltransferase
VRGEITLVVAGAAEAAPAVETDAQTLPALYAELVSAGRTRREAVKEAARRLGLPAREVYRRLLDTDGG